ncbi:MAG: hypothetical protein ABGZ23_20970 [Fuerstiella sp.]
MTFDSAKATLKDPDMFQRFDVGPDAISLPMASLAHDEQLLVFQRHGDRRALLARQMVYRHVAQGELAGSPFLVTF